MIKYLSIFLVLFSIVYSANFRSTDFDSTFFNADLSITSDFALVQNGRTINNGDSVCSSSSSTTNSIVLTPSITSSWTLNSAEALWPFCEFGNCPTMVNGGSISAKNIGWISSSKYSNHNTFGDSNAFTQSSSRYNDLATFHSVPVTYNVFDTERQSGKRADANVFCKGKLEVRDGSTVIRTFDMPSVSPVSLNLADGTHQITTRLTDVECFAVAAKYPLDLDNQFFYMTYYTQNQPTFGSGANAGVTGSHTETITVIEGGACGFHETSLSASSSLSDEDLVLVEVTMRNDEDQILYTDVTSSKSGYLVDPFPVSICNILGFSTSFCPSSNGFNEAVNSGSNQNLYVLIERTSGTGGTTLTFTGESVAPTCGSISQCTDSVSLEGAIRCEIEPPSNNHQENMYFVYEVTCFDLGGDVIPCQGNNWELQGISGDFWSSSNSQAEVAITSSPGSDGRLVYRSGIAECFSTIDTVPSDYQCEFIPSSANLDPKESRYFELNCFEGNTPRDPQDADYQIGDGLDGSITNSSTDGTSFTGGNPSKGDLIGKAGFPNLPPGYTGSRATAKITVGDGGNETDPPGGDNPGGGDDPHDGSSEFCTIGNGPLSVFPGYTGWISISCGPNANLPCSNVTWWAQGEAAIIPPSSDSGTYFNVTGIPGQEGFIHSYVDGDPDHSCFRGFTIEEPYCWEFS